MVYHARSAEITKIAGLFTAVVVIMAGCGFLLPIAEMEEGSKSTAIPLALIFAEQAKLMASDGATSDGFGSPVAISGETVVASAFRDGDAGDLSGSAYVFVRSGTTWAQQAKLTASDAAAFDIFGESVAIEGETALVGATGDENRAGAAYVFVRSGTTWTQQAKLTASDADAADLFGHSVGISGDTAIVGARADDAAGLNAGAAYVFVRSGTTWTQQAKLTASDAALGDFFGWSSALSGDTAIVGARGNDDAGDASGSAYVFVRSGTTWTQQAKLTAGDAAQGDNFGESVAISDDSAVVGAQQHRVDGVPASGAAYVFLRSDIGWTQQAKLNASDFAFGDNFGVSVAITGNTVVVGAWANDDAGDNSGSAYVFARSGTTWTEQTKLTASDAALGDFFGFSVGISGDTIVAGAHGDDDNGSFSGSAYVFVPSPNSPPMAVDDTANTSENTPTVPIDVLTNDIDDDGDLLSIVPGSVTDPSNGTAVDNLDGTITYTPAMGFFGLDMFNYAVTDGSDTDISTVTVNVNAIPVAVDDSATTESSNPVVISVLLNDLDPDNAPAAISVTTVTQGAEGSVVNNGDDTVTYTRTTKSFKGDDTFSYTISDGMASANANVVVTVEAGPPPPPGNPPDGGCVEPPCKGGNK